jgi:hypothetical protein
MRAKLTFLVIMACLILVFPAISGATPVLTITATGVGYSDTVVLNGNVANGAEEVKIGDSGWVIQYLNAIQTPTGLELMGWYKNASAGTLTLSFSDSEGFVGSNSEIPFYLSFNAPNQGDSMRAYLNDPIHPVATIASSDSITEIPLIPGLDPMLKEVVTIKALDNYGEGGFSASFTSSPVPEPSSLLLLGSGLIGFCLFSRRKR